MSEWIVSAASSAVSPRRSVQARVSLSPAVKNVIRSSVSASLRTTSPSADSPPPRNSAASSGDSSASSASSWRSIAVGPVDELEQRLRRQRLELGRQLALPLRQRPACVEVRQQPLEIRDLRLEAHVPRLRLLADALEPPLDVVAVGDQELELQRLEVVGGDARAREAVEDDEERVHLAQVAE